MSYYGYILVGSAVLGIIVGIILALVVLFIVNIFMKIKTKRNKNRLLEKIKKEKEVQNGKNTEDRQGVDRTSPEGKPRTETKNEVPKRDRLEKRYVRTWELPQRPSTLPN